MVTRQAPSNEKNMKCPAEVYQPSPRPYAGLPDIDYPFHRCERCRQRFANPIFSTTWLSIEGQMPDFFGT